VRIKISGFRTKNHETQHRESAPVASLMHELIQRGAVEKSEELNICTQRHITSETKSILVIDDSADMLELQKNILELDGFEVFTAQGGVEAFKVLNDIDTPKIILLDVRMEDMSGPEFLSLLEEKKPEIVRDVPIVFLTAMQQVPQGKAAGFIKKPFDMYKYLEAVHRFINLEQQSCLRH
jgi:DNA-binding NtrC family response regulator